MPALGRRPHGVHSRPAARAGDPGGAARCRSRATGRRWGAGRRPPHGGRPGAPRSSRPGIGLQGDLGLRGPARSRAAHPLGHEPRHLAGRAATACRHPGTRRASSGAVVPGRLRTPRWRVGSKRRAPGGQRSRYAAMLPARGPGRGPRHDDEVAVRADRDAEGEVDVQPDRRCRPGLGRGGLGRGPVGPTRAADDPPAIGRPIAACGLRVLTAGRRVGRSTGHRNTAKRVMAWPGNAAAMPPVATAAPRRPGRSRGSVRAGSGAAGCRPGAWQRVRRA